MITGSIARSGTDGVKLCMEEGTFGPLLLVKFHPHRCKDKSIAPPKLKTEIFTEI